MACNQYLACLNYSFGAFCLGASIGWAIPARSLIAVTFNEHVWICTSLALGCATVALPAGFIITYFGRKPAMLCVGLPYIVSWIMLATCKRYAIVLMAARFLMGLCGGVYVVVIPIYCSETAKVDVRGKMVALFELFLVLGVLYSLIMGLFRNYLALCCTCAILPLLVVPLVTVLPETANYYMSRNKPEDAEKTMLWLRGNDFNVEQELIQMEVNRGKPGTKKSKWLGILICQGLMFFQHFTGFLFLISCSREIFNESGLNIAPEYFFLPLAVILFMAVLLSVEAMELTGRRNLLILSATLCLLQMALLCLYFTLRANGVAQMQVVRWVPVFSMCLFTYFYGVGLATVPTVLMVELFTEQFRVIGTATACTFGALSAFVSAIGSLYMKKYWGSAIGFACYSIMCLLAVIFIYILVPETKGKALAEIQQSLQEYQIKKKDRTQTVI